MAGPSALPPRGTFGALEATGHLGAGGFGAVYKVRHSQTGAEYALKVLKAGEGQLDPDAVARFGREMQILAGLKHPSIVRIHGAGRTPTGEPFYFMDLLEGSPLSRIVARRGKLPVAEAIALVAKVARAIGSAHAAGIVHRDLKPENIFIESSTGEPKVVDFGLAQSERKDFQRLTREGDVVGTAHYMAPEQAASEKATPRTDVWGLGIILFQLATGKLPYTGGNAVAVLSTIMTTPAPPPSSVDPSLPPELDEVFLRCCDHEPARRYPTAIELAQDLEAILRGEEPSAQGRMLARAQAASRRRFLFAAAGTVAVLAVGTSWLYAVRVRSAQEHAASAAEERRAAEKRLREDLDAFDPATKRVEKLAPVATRLRVFDAASIEDEALRARLEHVRPLATIVLERPGEASARWEKERAAHDAEAGFHLLGAETALLGGDPGRALERLARIDGLGAAERERASGLRGTLRAEALLAFAEGVAGREKRALAALDALDAGVSGDVLSPELVHDVRGDHFALEFRTRALLGELAAGRPHSQDEVAAARKRLEQSERGLARLKVPTSKWDGLDVLALWLREPGSANSTERALHAGDPRATALLGAQGAQFDGDREAALRLYDKILEISMEHDETFEQAWKEALCILLELGRFDEARARITAFPEEDRRSCWFCLARAWVGFWTGNRDQALEDCDLIEKNVQLAPDVAVSPLAGESFFLRGVIRAQKGLGYALAVDDFARAVVHDATPERWRVAAANAIVTIAGDRKLREWALRSLGGERSPPPRR